MKCKFLRDMEVTHPDLKSHADIRELANQFHSGQISQEQYRERMRITVKAGAVIDHPKAYQLVQMGVAEPVDQECKNRANIPERKFPDIFEAYDRLDSAQITGDPRFDASDEDVAAMRETRARRRAGQPTPPATA